LKIPGVKLVGKAEEAGNLVGVPMTRGLGLSDLLACVVTFTLPLGMIVR
jgi:hypothetical protein